ncbi:MAG: TIM barrel protein [Verrucomicrobiaceae bacterium]|nr:TIM barrel protein [Verrucomicrobiaceae bacterium]
MNRRHFITAASLAAARSLLVASGAGASRLGICTFSCHQRWKLTQPVNAAAFYRYARELGAEGVQSPLRGCEPKTIRELVEQSGGYYEGELRLPKSAADLAAFEAEVRQTREAGATVARAVFTNGRRYEAFSTLEAFQGFHEQCKRTLGLIEPVLKKHRLRLAIENHKDHTTEELIGLMKSISSEWIGVLVDTGNNLALLEEPHGVIEALAPYALSVHLKDMAVQSADDGFLLSEVPLGSGFLDVPRMVSVLRKANPAIVLNLEMATRDPLRIPCRTDAYFGTFPDRKATHLDAALRRVKENPPQSPVPVVNGKSTEQVLAEEERNNRDGLQWMKQALRS